MKIEKHLGITALVAAILASSCCWLPLLLIAVGAGSAIGFASSIEKYRAVFGVIAFIVLGTAFYFAYRKPKDDCCAAGTPISKVKTFNKIMLWVITPFVVSLVLFSDKIFSALASNKSSVVGASVSKTLSNSNAKVVFADITLKVDGMT